MTTQRRRRVEVRRKGKRVGPGKTIGTRTAQDAGATEEKVTPWGKWHRYSCLCAVDEAWDSELGKPHGIVSPLLIHGSAIKTPHKPFHYSNLKNSNRR